MKNITKSALTIVAYAIWILGGIGALIVGSSISETFNGTIFEDIGRAMSTVVFISTAFSVFSSGLVFYALATIINILETNRQKDNDVTTNTSPILAIEKILEDDSSDILKF